MAAYNLRYIYLAVFVCLNIVKAYFPDLILDFDSEILLPVWALGATISSDDWQYSKKVSLSGTGSDETDYTIKLYLHGGVSAGDSTSEDVFLDNRAQTDFSDVRFTDAQGNLLDSYRADYGNYEIIKDSNLGNYNYISSDGYILRSKAGYVSRSSDNGENWTNIYTIGGSGYSPVWIDSNGVAYISILGEGRIYRSTNWKEASPTWTVVLDTSDVDGYIAHFSHAESSSGVQYAGRYQTTNNPQIYKSSDAGETWTAVFGYTVSTAWAQSTAYSAGDIVRPTTANDHLYVCTTAGTASTEEPSWPTTARATVADGGVTWTETNFQHVHGLGVDPVSGYVYAGIDGTVPALIRSTDEGTTWKAIKLQDFDSTGFYFGTDYRLIFAGATQIRSGNGVAKTTDDSTFTPSLFKKHVIQGSGGINSLVVAGGCNYDTDNYATIFGTEDGGDTWKSIRTGPYDSNVNFSGWKYFSNEGTPAGGEKQIIVGGSDGNAEYVPLRVYAGGSHRQATFNVKVPSLPAAGGDIYVWYGNADASDVSNSGIFSSLVEAGIKWRWKLDEGEGTSIADSGATGKNGTLTAGASGAWNAFDGRFAGAQWPRITKAAGASYYFDGASYITITNGGTDAAFQTANMTKNYTVVAWVRTTNQTTPTRVIFGKGYGNSIYSLGASSTGVLNYSVGYGSGVQIISRIDDGSSALYAYINDGSWHMVGASVDNETPANVRLIVDGNLYNPQALTYDYAPSDDNRSVKIGACDSANTNFIGDIDEVTVYDHPLTALEVQQIYEDRKVAATDSGRSDDAVERIVFENNQYKVVEGGVSVITDGVTVNNFTVTGTITANENCTIHNTIGYNSSGDSISIASGKTVTGQNNLFGDAAKSGDGTYTDSGGTLWNADPLFRSATDYRLKAGSPAINAGTDVGLTTDYDGKPIRGVPDIGAYEYYGATGNFGFGFGMGF